MTSSILWKLVLSFLLVFVGNCTVAMFFKDTFLSEKWNKLLIVTSGISLIVGFVTMIFAVWFTNMS